MNWGKQNKVAIPPFEKDNLGGVYGSGAYFFVIIKPNQKHWDLVDTIIHESVHVYQGAMRYVQETSIGDETQAYNIANIAVNLLKDFELCRG